jgi:hypothetical protein
VRRLEEAVALLPQEAAAEVLVARDQRVLRLSVAPELGPPADATHGTVQLLPDERATAGARRLRKAWLSV